MALEYSLDMDSSLPATEAVRLVARVLDAHLVDDWDPPSVSAAATPSLLILALNRTGEPYGARPVSRGLPGP